MKNKKEVQVKQMKRELAGLLESGQDQTARIRVLLLFVFCHLFLTVLVNLFLCSSTD